jgi:hypothetical protein
MFVAAVVATIAGGTVVLAVAPVIAQVVVPLVGACAAVTLYRVYVGFLGTIELQVTPAALSWRRAWDDVDACAISDVRSVDVTRTGAAALLNLRLAAADVILSVRFGYDDETLSWIGLRLQRAIEVARSAGASSRVAEPHQ